MVNTLLARRKYPRRRFLRPIGVLFKGTYYIAQGLELGEGGMLIEFDVDMDSGTHCLVNFRIPGKDFGIVRCEVRSILDKEGQKQFGLKFLKLAHEFKQNIRAHIAAKTLLESEEEYLAAEEENSA